MGLWKSLFGGVGYSKNDLIRSLAKQRVRDDPMANAMGFNEHMIDSLGMIQLAGLPESTIVAIVETYAVLKKKGVSDQEIFQRIEAHRSSVVSGEMPKPLHLDSYILYRIRLEHSHGFPISEDYINEAIRISRIHYGC
ncbi:MAG: hypothetical protein WA126_08155 [Thermodesulfovibrionales bacterium]